MPNSIVAEMQARKWAMEPTALKSLVERAAELADNAILTSITVKNTPKELKIVGDLAVIRISGVLLKTVPGWLRFFGIEATSYGEIREQIQQALNNKSVKGIHLQVDSPGGEVAGGIETVDAIFNAGKQKPVTATIEDLAASGAYFLTSQAGSIESNRNAMVGSMGVFTVYADFSEADAKRGVKIIVIRSGEHKGMGIDKVTDNQIAAVKDMVDGMANNFIAAVARGRGMESKKVRELATGQLWLSTTARELGLIDTVFDNKVQDSQNKSNLSGEKVMETEKQKSEMKKEEKEQAAADVTKIVDQTKSDERRRLTDLKAAFGEDLEFATKAFEDGLSVEQAKARYCEILQARNKEQSAEKKASEEQHVGAKAIESEDNDEGQIGDFMTEARQMAEEKKITVTAAMKRLRRENPQLHEQFKARCKTESHQMYAEAV